MAQTIVYILLSTILLKIENEFIESVVLYSIYTIQY